MQSIFANPINSIIALAWVAFVLYWGISAIGTKPANGNKNWIAAILMAISAVGLFLLLRFALIPKNINYLLWQRGLLLSSLALTIVEL